MVRVRVRVRVETHVLYALSLVITLSLVMMTLVFLVCLLSWNVEDGPTETTHGMTEDKTRPEQARQDLETRLRPDE